MQSRSDGLFEDGATARFRLNPIRLLGMIFFKNEVYLDGPPSTFARFCTSQHVADLQLVVCVTVLFAVVLGFTLLWGPKVPSSLGLGTLSIAGTLSILGGIVNWCYQTGSKRLGVVDLFGSEIGSICRMGMAINWTASVIDQTNKLRLKLSSEPTALQTPRRLMSEEHYTPVYDGSLSDLQPLNINVINAVTEFYQYRKIMMDYLRAAYCQDSLEGSVRFLEMMIYMQYLMLESARHAISTLVEFEPNRNESLINVYCQEILCYDFLKKMFAQHDCPIDEIREKRLDVRRSTYLDAIPKLYLETKDACERNKSWAKAKASVEELRNRFVSIFGEDAFTTPPVA